DGAGLPLLGQLLGGPRAPDPGGRIVAVLLRAGEGRTQALRPALPARGRRSEGEEGAPLAGATTRPRRGGEPGAGPRRRPGRPLERAPRPAPPGECLPPGGPHAGAVATLLGRALQPGGRKEGGPPAPRAPPGRAVGPPGRRSGHPGHSPP